MQAGAKGRLAVLVVAALSTGCSAFVDNPNLEPEAAASTDAPAVDAAEFTSVVDHSRSPLPAGADGTSHVEAIDDVSLLAGEPPSAIDPPAGRRFITRCRYATDECRTIEPEMREVAPDWPRRQRASTRRSG